MPPTNALPTSSAGHRPRYDGESHLHSGTSLPSPGPARKGHWEESSALPSECQDPPALGMGGTDSEQAPFPGVLGSQGLLSRPTPH